MLEYQVGQSNVISFQDLIVLIEQTFDVQDQYKITRTIFDFENCFNGSEVTVCVDRDRTDFDDMRVIEHWQAANIIRDYHPIICLETLMDYMCDLGVVEPNEYTIDISW